MRHVLSMGMVLLSMILWTSGVLAAGPYLQLEAGVLSRDVVEDVEVVQDSEVVGSKFRGEAVSTRVLAKAGIELWELLNLYVRGGGADLSIEEFGDYDADLGLGLWRWRAFERLSVTVSRPTDLICGGECIALHHR